MLDKKSRTTFKKPPKRTAMTDSPSPASADFELLQFKIPKNIKREFRQLAMDEDMTMTDLFLKMFESYK